MSAIGKIISMPQGAAQFAIVKDEYGNNRSVVDQELPKGAKVGDDMAYRLDFLSDSGQPTLVRYDKQGSTS